MPIDLTDVTFLIPFKKDSDQRLRNINFVIKYISKYFNTNISIMEQDTEQKFVLEPVENTCKITYEFIKTDNYLFHRTKLLNMMAKKATTSVICLYDLDVIFTVDQYIKSYQAISTNACDMIFPYDGRFINYAGESLNNILNTVSLDGITEQMGGCYNPNSVGGAIFYNKKKFIEYGMENENFISWGFEDIERTFRANVLGLRIARVAGLLYHLNHPTSDNSSNIRHKAYIDNNRELNQVQSMNQFQLQHYVKTWSWCK